MNQVPLHDAAAHLPDLIAAAMRGEVVIITTDSQDTVQLVPVRKSGKKRQFGSARGLIQMSDDFDAPLKDFEAYM